MASRELSVKDTEMREPFVGEKSDWLALVKKRWPKAKVESAGGGQWFAVSAQLDMAFFSVVQGGGWIRQVGYPGKSTLGGLFLEEEMRERARRYFTKDETRQKARIMKKTTASWPPRSKYTMSVGALLYALDTGKFLLGKRGPTIEDPNVWGTFGGGVDEGESLEGALKRELFEEAGYKGPMTTQPLYVYCDQKTGFRYFNHLAVIPKQFDPALNFETSEVSWFAWPSAPSPLHPGVKSLFADPASRIVIESVLEGKPVRGTM
jgi:8-oxo-dGTP pyrophosphatase MutT (NUDIX family)